MVTVLINNKPVHMEFDTGSCVSIIKESTWKYLGKITLHKSNHALKSFTGQSIKIIGERTVDVKLGSKSAALVVLVASGTGQNILGRDWIHGLQLHVEPLSRLKQVVNSVSESRELQVGKLVDRFKDVFEPGEGKCCKEPAHLYLKKDAIPVFKRARPVPLALRDKFREELDRLIKNGVLEEIDYSEWAAPCVIVKKPNGALRICADFSTGLNQALEVQKYPLPTHDELFAKLNGGQRFTTLDLSDAYLSIPMDETSKKLMVINTCFGLFRYNRLCFGVAPATAIFQKRMYSMLQGLEGVAFLLDDVIVTGKDDTEHLRRLEEVLRRIKEHGFCLNKSKCKFMQERVNYLGLSVSRDGITTNPDKVKAVLEMPEPRDVKELSSFLGMANFYSKFIPMFSDICAPLNMLRRKDVPWTWTRVHSEAVQAIKNAITSAPLLVHYDRNLPIVVAADASSFGIGCAIYHRFPDGQDRPIAFASKTLSSAEKNYSQIEREALGIIYALKKFRIYLWGNEFLIQTDHRPLLSIFGSNKGVPTTTSCRLQRWALFLSSFRFQIEYVPTKEFGKVDCFSRLPVGDDTEFNETDCGYNAVIGLIFSESVDNLPVSCNDIKMETLQDPLLRKVLKFVLDGWPEGKCDAELQPFKTRANGLSIHEGCLVWGVRTIIPPKLRNKILLQLHETHLGIVKMKALARQRVWWPGMDAEIETIARTCALCNTHAPREPKDKYLISWPASEEPWSRIHVDHAGPFMGKIFLLIVDSFSGWLEAVTVPSTTSSETVKQLKILICRYGIPKTIVTDNATCFTSTDFTKFCEQFGIKHVTTPTYHPESNGQVEKYVDTVKTALRKLSQDVSSKGLEADLYNFLFQYRVTPHSRTGVSPGELFMGRRLRCPMDLACPTPPKSTAQADQGQESPKKQFSPNQPVYWAETRFGRVLWKPGKIKKRIGKNTWQVEIGGRVFKKHADQLRPRAYKADTTSKTGVDHI